MVEGSQSNIIPDLSANTTKLIMKCVIALAAIIVAVAAVGYDSSSSASYEVAKKTVGVYNYGYNAGYNKGYGLYNPGYGYTRYNKGYGLYNRGYGYNKYNRGYGYARRGFGHNKGYATKKTSGSYSVEYTNKYGMDKSASGSYEVTRSYPTYNRGYGYARRGYGYGRKNYW